MAATLDATRFLRFSPWDGVLVGLSLAHAAVLLLVPSIPVVAIGLWWNANTVAHTFIHTPFFTSRRANVAYSMYLSTVLGIPQTLWRDRHLAHHAGRSRVARRTRAVHDRNRRDSGAVGRAGRVRAADLLRRVSARLSCRPRAVLPAGALRACARYDEPLRPALQPLFLQRRLSRRAPSASGRALDATAPDRARAAAAQQLAARPPLARRVQPRVAGAPGPAVVGPAAVRARGARARVAELLPRLPPVTRVTIVGGGLFPRTALIRPVAAARSLVDHRGAKRRPHRDRAPVSCRARWTFRQERLTIPRCADAADLIVIPLAFIGDRERVYRDPPAPVTFVHDWMWRQQAPGVPGLVAAAEEAESRHALRAICLLRRCSSSRRRSRCLVNAGVRDAAIWSPWSPCRVLWQDVLVALVFLLFDAASRRPWLAWIAYSALVGYAAINVPITCGALEPLTLTLIRATGGALTDSITPLPYAARISPALALPVAAAIALPRWLTACSLRIGPWVAVALVLVALGLVAIGPVAVSRVDTSGLHRNAVGALVSTSLPRLLSVEDLPEGPESRDGWRVSPVRPGNWRRSLTGFAAVPSGRNVAAHRRSSPPPRATWVCTAPSPDPDADADRARAKRYRLRAGVRRVSGKHQRAVRHALLALPGVRYPAGRLRSVPCSSLADRLRSSGYQTALFHSGPIRLSRDAIDHRPPWLRHARRRRRHRRQTFTRASA